MEDNIVKMSILLKVTCRFNAIPIKIPVAHFTEMEKLILKSITNCKGPQVAKTILIKHKVEEFTLPDIKTYHKATAIETR